MKERPLSLVAIAFIFVAIALSFPFQIMGFYGHGPGEVGAILNKLTYMNWLVIAGLLVAAYYLYEASPQTRYAIPVVGALVAVNNFFVAFHGTDYSPWTATVATFAFGALVWPVYRPDIKNLLLNPDQRWWRIAARKSVQIPVVLSCGKHHRVRGETFDISESGMFVPLHDHQTGLKLQQRVAICLNLGAFAQVRCDGRIARIAEASGRYPSGVGIEFLELSSLQRAEIRRYLTRRPRELTLK